MVHVRFEPGPESDQAKGSKSATRWSHGFLTLVAISVVALIVALCALMLHKLGGPTGIR